MKVKTPADVRFVLKRPIMDKIRDIPDHTNDPQRAQRLRAYVTEIERAISDGRADDAANFGWEAAHCWFFDDD